jgi:hypothetical protein
MRYFELDLELFLTWLNFGLCAAGNETGATWWTSARSGTAVEVGSGVTLAATGSPADRPQCGHTGGMAAVCEGRRLRRGG